MSDFVLEGRGRPWKDFSFLFEEVLEISEARLVENASEVEEEISFALVLEGCFIPYRPWSMMIPTLVSGQMCNGRNGIKGMHQHLFRHSTTTRDDIAG